MTARLATVGCSNNARGGIDGGSSDALTARIAGTECARGQIGSRGLQCGRFRAARTTFASTRSRPACAARRAVARRRNALQLVPAAPCGRPCRYGSQQRVGEDELRGNHVFRAAPAGRIAGLGRGGSPRNDVSDKLLVSSVSGGLALASTSECAARSARPHRIRCDSRAALLGCRCRRGIRNFRQAHARQIAGPINARPASPDGSATNRSAVSSERLR